MIISEPSRKIRSAGPTWSLRRRGILEQLDIKVRIIGLIQATLASVHMSYTNKRVSAMFDALWNQILSEYPLTTQALFRRYWKLRERMLGMSPRKDATGRLIKPWRYTRRQVRRRVAIMQVQDRLIQNPDLEFLVNVRNLLQVLEQKHCFITWARRDPNRVISPVTKYFGLRTLQPEWIKRVHFGGFSATVLFNPAGFKRLLANTRKEGRYTACTSAIRPSTWSSRIMTLTGRSTTRTATISSMASSTGFSPRIRLLPSGLICRNTDRRRRHASHTRRSLPCFGSNRCCAGILAGC